MRKGIVISLAVLLVVFLAIGCTDTGTDEGTDDTGVVPPEDNETTDEAIDDQATNDQMTDNETTDDQMTNQTTTEPTTTDNMSTQENISDSTQNESMMDNETVGGNEYPVTITQDGFDPFDVQITVGDTVTWTNEDSETHTVTDDEGVFDSGDLQAGESYSYTFEEAGTYTYGSTGETFEAEITVVTSTEETTGTGENTTGDVVVVPAS